jgi:hypothetical protein
VYLLRSIGAKNMTGNISEASNKKQKDWRKELIVVMLVKGTFYGCFSVLGIRIR